MDKFIKSIFNKIQSLKKKHIIIGIAIIISIIIFIVAVQIIQEKNYIKEVKNKEYYSANDFKTAKEYIIYSGNEYIKEEDSKVDNISKDIYLRFKVDLFEDEESNEEFYTDLINIVAHTLYYDNFRLIDKDKNLIITVFCDKENNTVRNIYYNGVENYFSIQNSKKMLQNYSSEEQKEYEVNSRILNDIVNNKWEISKVKLKNRKEVKNDYLIYDDFMVRNISKKIYNIVFLNNYDEPIINGIKVGTSQEEIINKLGQPNYDSLGIIGYKDKNIYVFFGTNTVSVYRVENDESIYDGFIDLVEEFRQTKSSKKFISNLTEIWDDFNEYEVEDNYIEIEYALKGVKIQFNVTNEHGIILYDNYKGEVEKGTNIYDIKGKEDYELPLYTYIHSDESLILNSEINRAFEFEEIDS